jgi:hypothetical protein
MIALLLLPFSLSAQQSASADVLLARTVVSAGAVSSTGSVSLSATFGQLAMGRVQSGSTVAMLGFWPTGIDSPTGIGDTPPGLARALDLSVYPNPFRERAELRIMLDQSSSVRATVYDVSGRLIARIAHDLPMQAGTHVLGWHGKNDHGLTCLPGLYFIRVEATSMHEADSRLAVQPLLLLR